MKLSDVVRGLPGHPLHPPLTDATIGAYTTATALGALGALGVSEGNLAKGWWLALIVGLAVTAPTALTGSIDWLGISRGSALWRTATAHMLAMLTATVFFLLASVLGYDGYSAGDVTAGPLVLTLIGFATITLGGWLGGTIVFVHGMRVLNLSDEPALRAATPRREQKEQASGADGRQEEARAGLTRY